MDLEIEHDIRFSYEGMPTLESQQSQTKAQSRLWGSFVIWLVEVVTGPKFGVFAAICSVAVVQYKSNIENFLRNAVEDGWQQTILECMLGLGEMIRAYYQMTCEVLRSIRRTQDPQPVQAMAQARTIVGSSPPPLVVLHPESEGAIMSSTYVNYDSSDMIEKMNSTQRIPPSSYGDEIEPAFLDEQDYPPGWLVYHPLLGVVSKDEADSYDRNQQKKQLEQPVISA